jgi:hypothetical protein
MKRTAVKLVACLLAIGAVAFAQEQMEHAPPKVLTVTREWVKPGKNGSTHEKSESAFVQAMERAKWPTHYLAVDSLSGKPRSLFFTGYDSFDAWEKDTLATQKDKALSAALDRAGVADGELLTGIDQGVMIMRPDLSLRPNVDIPHMRYFEISRFHVRPGHMKEWEALVKLYQQGCEKITNCHWAAYQSVYGFEDDTYIIFNPMKTAAEIDRNFGDMKAFSDTLGDEGMKKLADLVAAIIESSETNLFVFNPRMSYPSAEWVKADPEFWKPKPAAESKKPAAKPAEKPAAQ